MCPVAGLSWLGWPVRVGWPHCGVCVPAPPQADLIGPLLVLVGGNVLIQLVQHVPHIAHDGDVYSDVLADLGGIDVDVDDLGVGGKLLYLARHPVVEPHAHGD